MAKLIPFLLVAALSPSRLLAAADAEGFAPVTGYVERLARSDGGYGWEDEPTSHLTPTWAVVGIYRLLGAPPPRPEAVAEFVRTHHPYRGPHAETKRHAAEMRSFVLQQIEALKWLGQDLAPFLDEVRGWKLSSYPSVYEKNGYPLFQQEALVFAARELLGLPAREAAPELSSYLASRRRPDGSFNNTPASDGSGGHVLHTWSGLQALRTLGRGDEKKDELIAWLRACQLPSGGFTHGPQARSGAVEGVDYAWAAVLALKALGAEPADKAGAIRWLSLLWNADGGCAQRPGWPSDPVCTLQALEALRALGALEDLRALRRRAVLEPAPLARDLKPFTIQIQAPGQGSPEEAVELARALRIHLWGAKNSPAGWIERAQAVAQRRQAPVSFFVANEEYGTYIGLAGHGTYSHLSDPAAPAGVDFGASLAGKDPSWDEFVQTRLAPLRRAGGRMIWQICDNEEYSRILLDDSLARGGYAALSTFHMRQNFADTQTCLYRYRRVIPFVALQDAHGGEAWWWTDDLAGYRTIFLAAEPTWEAWLMALDKNWVVAARHDEVTRFRTRMLGGAAGVQEFLRAHEAEWRWWGEAAEDVRRPLASIVAVLPGDVFEAGRPAKGVALRVRMAWSNTPQGVPVKPLAELVSLKLDGEVRSPRHVERKSDKGQLTDAYEVVELPDLRPGRHVAEATVRRRDTRTETKIAYEFESP